MMNKIIIVIFLFTSLLIGQTDTKINTKFSIGAQFGLFSGVGGQISLLTTNFAEDFPFSIKLGLGLSYLDAGDPQGARRIFINNNTNGIPEKSGKTMSYSLDFLYKLNVLGLKRNYFYGGPRYLIFTGNFNFVGGNEDFDVKSNNWGFGFGIENYFKIIPSANLVINIGYDIYISDVLYGHDTSYSPENENVNPREEYNFKDADKAINQPKGEIKAMMGINYFIN